MTSSRSGSLNLLLTALVPIIWGTTYWVTSELLPAESPFLTAAIRTLPAGLLMIVCTRRFRVPIRFHRIVLLSAINITIFQALLFVSAYRLPGGIAAITGAFQPLLMMALLWIMERIRPSERAVSLSLLSISGMALLFSAPSFAPDLLGLLAAFGSTAAMAGGIYLTKCWSKGAEVSALVGWQLMLGGVMLIPFALMESKGAVVLTWDSAAGYAYLVLFGTLLAYFLWFRGVALLPAVSLSSLGLLSPISAIAIGWLFLGEALSSRELAGMLLALVSIFCLQRHLMSNQSSGGPKNGQPPKSTYKTINTNDNETQTSLPA